MSGGQVAVVSVDVVVVGLGDAGATAAVAAHDAGANVLVLEQQASDDHRPNSRYAAGFFIAPDDPDEAATYLRGLYAVSGEVDEVDPMLVDTWLRESLATLEWLDDLGCPYERWGYGGEHETLPGVEGIGTFQVRYASSRVGCPLHAFLLDQVAARGIQVRHETEVCSLLADDGRIVGVGAVCNGSELNVHANAVVLATGGYEANSRMIRHSLPVWPVHFFGTRRNHGAGVWLATRAGADLWHMNTWPGRLVAHLPDSGYDGGIPVRVWGAGPRDQATPGGLFVDRSARRFMAEPGRQHAAHLHVHAMDAVSLERPGVPVWWVFDQRRFDAGALVTTTSGPAGPLQEMMWSVDNTAEVSRGWIRQGRTLTDLAASCDLDPDQLEQTVARYNAACADGVDWDFGRDPSTLTSLDRPSFYALQLWPGGSHTVGGPRRDARCRVLRPDGSTVDGLLACGELGSIHGLLYPSGGASLTECLAFGRVAGREAAAVGAGDAQ